MLRTDGLMLAYLLARDHPEQRDAVRRVLKELGREARRASVVGQALIRRKLLGPKDFIRLQNCLESTRRRCKGCGRAFMVVADERVKRRRCGACGRLNRVPAMTLPEETHAGVSARLLEGSGSRRGLPRRIGRYAILDRVGDGGMGVIFTATDPKTGGVVALKLLRSDASDDVKLRFQREAESLARLEHPAIVRIFDVGRDGDQRFFTMEYVQGKDMHQLLPQFRRNELIGLVATIAEGLHHAHEHGIIHRDVKPHNVILDSDGTPKLADFGLARDLERSSLTEMGELVGTPLYMAPEQLRGDPSLIDARTDVYALGVLLYEGLTQRLPIEARSFVELQQKLTKVVPLAPSRVTAGIPPDLDRIVMKALEKESRDRYQSALALGQDLRAFLEGESVAGRPVAPSRRAGRRVAQAALSPLGLGLMSAAVIVVGVAIALLQQAPGSGQDPTMVQQRETQRTEYLRKAREARRSLMRARAALAREDWDEARAEAQECLGSTRNLRALGAGLGESAPTEVVQDLEKVELGAEATLAQALAPGGPRERAQARDLLRGLLETPNADVDLRVMLGRLELRDGHLPAAFDQLNRALSEAAGRSDARYYRAEAHRRLGRPRFALLDYEQALLGKIERGGVSRAEVLAGLTLAQIALGELDAARETLDSALSLAAQDPRVRLAKAALLQANGSDQEALRELSLLARTTPDDAEVRLARAMAWARAGDQERAQEELAEALLRDPSADAYTLRGRLRALACDDEGARADLEQALEHSQAGDPVRVRIRLARARHLRTLGRYGEAIATLDHLLPPVGKSDGVTATQLPLLLERAESRSALGRARDLREAAEDVDLALRLVPDHPRALLDRARLWLLSGAPVRAEQTLAPLLQSQPPRAEVLALQVGVARKQGRDASQLEARARASQSELLGSEPALGLDVGPPLEEAALLLEDGRRLLARALKNSSQPSLLALAAELLRRAALLAPWLTSARASYAEAQAASGETMTALENVEQILEECAPSVGLHTLHGRLLAELERHEDALLAFQESLTLLGSDASQPGMRQTQSQLFLLRARSAERLGRIDDALLDLDTAIVLNPRMASAYELRQALRQQTDDKQGALKDAERVDLLRRGHRRIIEQGIQAAWSARSRGDDADGVRALAPAFEALSPEVDPTLAAQLHYVRGYLYLRDLKVQQALLDFGRMLELWPPAFLQLYDVLDAFRSRGSVSIDRIVDGMGGLPHDVDPDFLRGFKVFLRVEFGPKPDRAAVDEGLRGLERFLDRYPGHTSALLLRADLLLEAKRPGGAMRSVVAVLQERRPPPFAHYLLARIRSAQGDVDGAITALGSALLERFNAYELIGTDPYLDAVRDDPRTERLLQLSEGAGFLWETEQLEAAADSQPEANRRQGWERAAASATTGLQSLRSLIQRGDPQARLLAARLYLARARLVAAAGNEPQLRHDLSSALEASPGVLLEWGLLSEAAVRLKGADPRVFENMQPWGQELLPGRFAEVIPIVLEVLRRGEADDEALARARTRLDRLGEEDRVPAIEAWQALLALAAGEPEAALELSARLEAQTPSLAPTAAWLRARVHASRDERDEAFAALRVALAGGLRGPLVKDPLFARLQRDERFRGLAAWARANEPRSRW